MQTIYIARPTTKRLRHIVKEDLTSAKVNKSNLKIGKALNFDVRIKDYIEDNDGEVEVKPIVDLEGYTKEQVQKLETAIKKDLKKFAVYNEPGLRPNGTKRIRRGRTEWLQNISFCEVEQVILKNFAKM